MKKTMGSTDQILEELVVTPKATNEAKKVTLSGLQALRVLCKQKQLPGAS